MENDYLVGIIAGTISLTILIITFMFLNEKHNQFIDKIEKQNKEILNILK